MDTGSPANVSVTEDVNGSDDLKPLCSEPSQCTYVVLEDVSLTELENGLTQLLHIQDDQNLASNFSLYQPPDGTNNQNVVKENDLTESTVITSEKSLSKCSTLCFGKEALHAVSTDEEDGITAAVVKHTGYESVMPAYPRSISLPTPSKLVSAMKGSREKQGTLQKKLTVTWAPDVYDPLPAASTTVKSKQPRNKSGSKKYYESKKNGKKKQKGKPSKGSNSKDKKQVRKHGGSSNYHFQSLDVDDSVVDCNEPCRAVGDFGVGSPNSYCGSSFLRKSITKLHFSIAEAT